MNTAVLEFTSNKVLAGLVGQEKPIPIFYRRDATNCSLESYPKDQLRIANVVKNIFNTLKSASQVVLIESPFLNIHFKKILVEILFSIYSVEVFYSINRHQAALNMLNLKNGICIDIKEASLLPIIDSFPMYSLLKSFDLNSGMDILELTLDSDCHLEEIVTSLLDCILECPIDLRIRLLNVYIIGTKLDLDLERHEPPKKYDSILSLFRRLKVHFLEEESSWKGASQIGIEGKLCGYTKDSFLNGDSVPDWSEPQFE